MTDTVAAVDLGASSGRVMVGHVGPHTLELEEAYRFANDPVTLPDGCIGTCCGCTTTSWKACGGPLG